MLNRSARVFVTDAANTCAAASLDVQLALFTFSVFFGSNVSYFILLVRNV